MDVLDAAFHQNEQMAMKLLTSEMEAWSHFTCLQMAVSSCHRPFVSHSCTQTLLTDLWSGPLNTRKNSSLKVSVAAGGGRCRRRPDDEVLVASFRLS